ncbi:Annexin [Bimuria novae-zelandiae CBS 107.79]|uniref:Annexin n=1 Tax=Bimuria novae-zelandiae CBS 107.79 TaxID=1447943 RepID=A0A6A5VGJ6_9PLEO|nr:Annexin [Bimuria novae-zelandiae CBS 107.79]
MSLRPDDRDRKGRSSSKSPGRRDRSRSRSHVRAPSPGPGYFGGYSAEPGAAHASAAGYEYEVRQPGQPYGPPGGEPITMGGYTDLPPEQRPGYMQQAQQAQQHMGTAGGPRSPGGPNVSYSQQGHVQYASGQHNYTTVPAGVSQAGPVRAPSQGGGFQYAQAPQQITFTAKPVVPTNPPPSVRHTTQPASPPYAAQSQYAMPQAPPPTSSAQQAAYPPSSMPPPPMGAHSPQPGHQRAASHSGPTTSYSGHQVVEMVLGGVKSGGSKPPPSPGLRPHSLSVSGGAPGGLSQRMDRLSVSGNRPDIQTIVPGGFPGGGGGMPPPSPLLEAYHGTYQSISPMPHAMMMDDDLDHLQPLDNLSPRGSTASFHGGHGRSHSTTKRSPSPARRSKHKDKLALEAYGRVRDDRDRSRDRRGEKEKRRVKIYNAEEDAVALVDALSSRNIDADTIIDILPALSHDQMLELRSEYKRHCKVQGRGINIAKHIKLKTTGNFGKIAYVTALGKYESEGYWANFWYQSGNARRELLIEALMGRQNYEIREIKDAFRDKRYGDSLTRCMDKELKADKFRKAVLMALEGERQEESDVWPTEYRNRDVDTLYKALKAREGGESAMLGVVVMRSDAHLREVLRTYERKYQGNFARDALRKSNNLVGEVIAHILNGVINRPSRDAMLLHHALMDLIEPPSSHSDGPRGSSSKVSASSKHERQQRYELLISRLVRLHWDRMHLQRVKMEYDEKYGRVVEEDIEEATKGDFREFSIQLCQTQKGR